MVMRSERTHHLPVALRDLSLSKAVSASGSQHSSRPALSVTVTSVKCKLDFFKCRTKTALIVPSRGTAGT